MKPAIALLFTLALSAIAYLAGRSAMASPDEVVQSKADVPAQIQWPPAREDIVNVYRDIFHNALGEKIPQEKIAPLPSSFRSGHTLYQVYLAPPDQWLTVVDASMTGAAGSFYWAATTKQGEILDVIGPASMPLGGTTAGGISFNVAKQAQEFLPFTPIAGAAAIGWTIAPGTRLALISDEKEAEVHSVSLLGYLSKR